MTTTPEHAALNAALTAERPTTTPTVRRAVFVDPASCHLLALAQRVAAADVTTLLVGPTGSGKEVMARVLHESSPRRGGPFVAINCAALPEQLIESQLFGHERGAFTGALRAHPLFLLSGQIIQIPGAAAMQENASFSRLHFYLVRGLIREARHWGTLPVQLQAVFPAARITCIDLPGAGVNHRLPSPWRVQDMVGFMRQEFLHQRTAGETAVLLAISLGGMIAAHWLRTFPQDFQRAVLINTSYGGLSPLLHRLRPRAMGVLAKVALAPPADKEATILSLVSNHGDARTLALPLWNAIRADRPVSLANTVRQLWAASRFRLGEGRPVIPVLLLAGTQDRLVNVACSRAIARHWGLPLKEHPSAGHDLPLDDPTWIVNEIHQFVNDSGGKVVVG